ncbi:tRNA pseudouridine synthase [Nesidiocoris tenuis]|uniref:tRNA pseudouridine synthase n=1 Tax=Nesidiocoris tenuis TaxID=355587 RepID=A0ABN7AJA9_9HEMI|nr:tRNA pseudouridine synthase [Nesidiocoris tenuis]
MKRYLIYFSYLGTRFRGSQKQFNKGIPVCPTETVQSLLEHGLAQLRPINQPVVYPASRTDQGVHALCTAAHVDIVFYNDLTIYGIMKSLNSFFHRHDFDIRVLNVREVPNTFSARYSVLRKRYLYRFAVANSLALPELPIKKHVLPIPIMEKDRCYFVPRTGFNEDAASEAAALFVGTKDFRAFMGRPSHQPDDVRTERIVESCELRKGKPLLSTPESSCFHFYEVSCSGKSFLYRQVRRTVGALIAVGLGRLSISDLHQMFENPTNDSWNSRAVVVPGYGLYLASVEYKEEDLFVEMNSYQEDSISVP